MASIGGFVAGPKVIIDYLRYNLRSQIYAKSLPMAFVEGGLKRLEIIRSAEGDELRKKLFTRDTRPAERFSASSASISDRPRHA